jgi:hypothetical protein
MFQDLSDRKRGYHTAGPVSNFNTGLTEWRTGVHKLPHQIAGAVFGFRQGVFQVGELRAFFVAGHSALIAQIYKKMGHDAVHSDQLILTLGGTCSSGSRAAHASRIYYGLSQG